VKRENVTCAAQCKSLVVGAVIDNLPDQAKNNLKEPLGILSENAVCERLDRVFEHWSREYFFENLATITLPGGGHEGEAISSPVSFWHCMCAITVPAQPGREAFSVSGDFICASNDKGAFTIHQKGAFLSAALKGFHLGDQSEGMRNSFLNSSFPASMLYLIGFDGDPEPTFIPHDGGDTSGSFLEHKSLSAHFFKIFRSVSLMLKKGGELFPTRVYLLFMDQRGIALLSSNPFPDQFPFELELQGPIVQTFSIDSLQRKHIRDNVDFYHMNFERFLPEKSFESLSLIWGSERRENVRIDRVVPLEVELSKHKRFYAITDNISLRGMRILHRHTIPPGVHVNCRIRLGGDEGDIMTKGLMVWKKSLMSGLNITGISFIAMERGVTRRLLRYLEREIIAELMYV
jgi:hypothetical protein